MEHGPTYTVLDCPRIYVISERMHSRMLLASDNFSLLDHFVVYTTKRMTATSSIANRGCLISYIKLTVSRNKSYCSYSVEM